MEPTLPDGSTVLVDLSVHEFSDNGIFLLQFEHQLLNRKVKYLTPARLVLDTGIWDGAEYEDWYIQFDKNKETRQPLSLYDVTNVIGKVVLVVTFL